MGRNEHSDDDIWVGQCQIRGVCVCGATHCLQTKKDHFINAGNNNKYKLGAQVTPSNRSPIKTFGQGCNSI